MNPAARHWIALLALAALSAFLQFANVRQTEQGGVVHGDAVKYVFYAYNLAHHDTFSRVQTFGARADVAAVPAPVPDKLTLPGYPWFVSKFLGDGPPDHAFLRRIEQPLDRKLGNVSAEAGHGTMHFVRSGENATPTELRMLIAA